MQLKRNYQQLVNITKLQNKTKSKELEQKSYDRKQD